MYSVKLLSKKDVAEGTMAFQFAKPADYVFQAGQHTGWTLINPPETDAEGDSRDFSFASAPYEDFLMIASRLRDTAFKRVLHNLELGAEIQMGIPEGHFVLHTDMLRPAVFLAGGIGITPFRSLVLDAAKRSLPHKIFLFYSNRRPEDAAFLDELKSVVNPNYQFIPTMTQMDKSTQPWTGETGYVTSEMLKKYIEELKTPVFYLAGPPKMVLALRETLVSIGVDDLSIKSEEFDGY